jgi:hypothetical protein
MSAKGWASLNKLISGGGGEKRWAKCPVFDLPILIQSLIVFANTIVEVFVSGDCLVPF